MNASTGRQECQIKKNECNFLFVKACILFVRHVLLVQTCSAVIVIVGSGFY